MVTRRGCRAWLAGCLAACAGGPALAANFIDVDAGVNYAHVSASEVSPADGEFDGGEAGYHFALGAYRNRDGSPWLYGVKVEVDDIVGNNMLSLRALDLGYRISPELTVNAFLGAARLALTTPATGWRVGLGGRYWFSDRFAVAVEGAYGTSLARDKLLPEENPGVGRPDIFYNVAQLSVFLKYRF